MSDRRRVDPSAIDEAMIRDLIGGHSPALLPREGPLPAPTPQSEPEPPQSAVIPATEYARLFLQPKKIKERRTCVMASGTMRKMEIIRLRLGYGLSLAALVDNIIQHHLDTYRGEINAMIKNVDDQI